MNSNNTQSGNSLPILIAIIAVIALAVLWFVFSQPEETVTDVNETANEPLTETRDAVVDSFNETVTEVSLTAARGEARAKLLALQAELEAEENYTEALETMEDIEAELAAVYRDAALNTQQEWVELQAEFDEAATSLRASSADALDNIATLIEQLESNIRTDDDNSESTTTSDLD